MNFPTIFRIPEQAYRFSILLLGSALILTLVQVPLLAKEVPPRSNTIVTDYAGILTDAQRNALERKLVAYDDTSSTQIAVVIERSLEGDDPFEYSLRLAEAWGIGQRGKDNGVLIYIAVEDRKIRIQTGYGAEGFLPDALSRRIIENIMKPAFRENDFYGGIDRATDAIIKLSTGEYTAEPEEMPIPPWVAILVGLLILILLIYLISRGGGGGGGGFGGFGGGGFGGGGAGGGW